LFAGLHLVESPLSPEAIIGIITTVTIPTTTDSGASNRSSLVDRARQSWITRLIDTSRRNNLLFFRDLKTGTLDVTGCPAEAIDEIISGKDVSFHALWPEHDLTAFAAKAREIARRAMSNEEERGLQTLFLAYGMATWPPDDDGRPAESAVFLIPIKFQGRLTEGKNLFVRREGEVQLNLALLHVLDSAHGCAIQAEDFFAEVDTSEIGGLRRGLLKLSDAASQVEGFSISERVVIGNFSFQKLAMVADLRQNLDTLSLHDMIAALAGYLPAKQSLSEERQANAVTVEDVDRTRADAEFLVIDADSSQQRVIASVLRGQSGVIQGPPGTGKSQTISNLIAALAAEGKRVLFVAEKRAALQVVMERLRQVGLDHLFLDLHGADITQRAVMQKIRSAIDVMRSVTPVATVGLHQRFEGRRDLLNQHVARLHQPRRPSGLSIYEIQARLLVCGHRPLARWHGSELERLDEAGRNRAVDLLRESAGFADLLLGSSESPWFGTRISDGNSAQRVVALTNSILALDLPTLQREVDLIGRTLGANHLTTFAAIKNAINIARSADELLQKYPGGVFSPDAAEHAECLANSEKGVASRLLRWFRPSFRNARRHFLGLRAAPTSGHDLAVEAAEVSQVRRGWPEISEGEVRRYDTAALKSATLAAQAHLEELVAVVHLPADTASDLGALRQFLERLAVDTVTPFRIPRYLEIERDLRQLALDRVVREAAQLSLAPSEWPAYFEAAWLSSCLDKARADDPLIAGFNGANHQETVEEFRTLDSDRIQVAIDRVKRAHAERALRAMNDFPEQAALVRQEAQKKTRHLPLRRLVKEAPDVLTALCPCWMASPLSVSQLLPGDRQFFDFVLFDEGSQILPEDAVPAILRARRTVIAGDRHQLPPTTFFADGSGAGGGDDEVLGAVEGFESVLDIVSTFVEPWSLDWHYRSRDERLIAFSNYHIYGNRLITFPGARTGIPPVTQSLVVQTFGFDGEEESSSDEVTRVIELIFEHATKRPRESLGVITMGIRHAQRIQVALDAAARDRSDLEAFFALDQRERFFIKNLERVQGDERDAIILSIGYGKDRAGNLRHSFGPLLYEGGERRLNVAVTRARSHMTVVSSFLASDVDPARAKGRGVQLLRAYLEYAASEGLRLGVEQGHDIPLNGFEADIYDVLSAKGINAEPQWGVAGYRIDLAAKHPARPGRFVLAIECDGASYHSAPTARDRDRLRQQQLEALGWRFHRIWSTDWFQRRADEINRLVAAYDAAVAFADKIDEHVAVGGAATPVMERVARRTSPENRARIPRPLVPVVSDITMFTDDQIDRMMLHISSDGLLRTDEELVKLTAQELGFRSVRHRIRERLHKALGRIRARG
jgi:very-short-patch-repair endonuclease